MGRNASNILGEFSIETFKKRPNLPQPMDGPDDKFDVLNNFGRCQYDLQILHVGIGLACIGQHHLCQLIAMDEA